MAGSGSSCSDRSQRSVHSIFLVMLPQRLAFLAFLLTSAVVGCVHLSTRDEYDRNYLVDQFRRHYQDRWQRVFQSRDGNYRVASRADDGDEDDDRGSYAGLSHWEGSKVGSRERHLDRLPPTLPPESNSPPIVHASKDRLTMEDQEIDHLRGLAQKNTGADTFKVSTRAQARQADNFNSNHLMDVNQKAFTDPDSTTSSMYFIAMVAGCSAAAVFGVMAAGFCWYKFQKNAKAAAEAEYPAYGVTGPNKEHVSPVGGGDRKLAQNAQMYHYQHQKQQMIAMEKTNGERQASTSDLDSEEENEEGDYTVYECPGLAPTGEMEVKNPLFQDEPTPASPSVAIKQCGVDK